MPITLLSDRKTAQDSGHHIFMWNEARNINYSPLSTHTNTACLSVNIQYACKCMCDQTTLLCDILVRVVLTWRAFTNGNAIITFTVFILSVIFVLSRDLP